MRAQDKWPEPTEGSGRSHRGFPISSTPEMVSASSGAGLSPADSTQVQWLGTVMAVLWGPRKQP